MLREVLGFLAVAGDVGTITAFLASLSYLPHARKA